jgi:acetyl-CoA C-acetyltransferase
MANPSDPVVIVSAARTPLGRFMGDLSSMSGHQLGQGSRRNESTKS